MPEAPLRRIIVNADDFGLSPVVNAGIERAHRQGILTSATLLTNAPFFDAATALAGDNPRLGVGLHLNLVRGFPLSPAAEIPRLVGADGRFRPFRVRRLTPDFLVQAEREYRRQFEKILSAGIVPTHIDFEKHHAWQGRLYGLACRLAREYGVGGARNLREPVTWSLRHMGWPGFSHAVEATLLRCGATLGGAERWGLAGPDRLLGQTHIGGMTETVWMRLLANLPPGTSEVMTHPGEAESAVTDSSMGGSWLAGARESELAALISSSVKKALEDSGAVPIHFGALTRVAVDAKS